MAGHARYTALLDACVLFPIATCNALMSVAGTGIFAAKWTARIDDESRAEGVHVYDPEAIHRIVSGARTKEGDAAPVGGDPDVARAAKREPARPRLLLPEAPLRRGLS